MRVTVTFTRLDGSEGIKSFDSAKEAFDWLASGQHGLLDYDIFFS